MKIMIKFIFAAFAFILLSVMTWGYKSLHDAAQNKKIIYLTFDDGPINVTQDVVKVLNDNNIKATFFINGIHLFGKGGENENHAIDSLHLLINSGDVIANHSYDHMMGYHTCNKTQVANDEFYNQYCSDQSLRTYFSPQEDIVFFEPLNTEKIHTVMYGNNFKPEDIAKNDHLNDIARMPFTNNWRVHKLLSHLVGNAPCATTDDKYVWNYTAADFTTCFSNPSVSAQNGFRLADLLEQRGYQVFGWDIEWSPNNWGAERPNETLMNAEQLANYTETAFDACIPHIVENPMQDRVPDLNCDSSLHKNKVIVLAHDFLFEDGKRGNGSKNLIELDKYIKMMKRKGYKFDTLDHY